MDVFDDAPCCLHLPRCLVAFCWACQWVRFRGACGADLLRDMGWTRDPRPRPS